jgi:hypothetical protein
MVYLSVCLSISLDHEVIVQNGLKTFLHFDEPQEMLSFLFTFSLQNSYPTVSIKLLQCISLPLLILGVDLYVIFAHFSVLLLFSSSIYFLSDKQNVST